MNDIEKGRNTNCRPIEEVPAGWLNRRDFAAKLCKRGLCASLEEGETRIREWACEKGLLEKKFYAPLRKELWVATGSGRGVRNVTEQIYDKEGRKICVIPVAHFSLEFQAAYIRCLNEGLGAGEAHNVLEQVDIERDFNVVHVNGKEIRMMKPEVPGAGNCGMLRVPLKDVALALDYSDTEASHIGKAMRERGEAEKIPVFKTRNDGIQFSREMWFASLTGLKEILAARNPLGMYVYLPRAPERTREQIISILDRALDNNIGPTEGEEQLKLDLHELNDAEMTSADGKSQEVHMLGKSDLPSTQQEDGSVPLTVFCERLRQYVPRAGFDTMIWLKERHPDFPKTLLKTKVLKYTEVFEGGILTGLELCVTRAGAEMILDEALKGLREKFSASLIFE